MRVDEGIIKRDFIKTLKIPKRKISPPLIIGLFGKICSGKSTVALAIAKKLPIVVLRTDIPRSMIIKKYGHNYNTIARIKRIVIKTGKELLEQQYSILVDAGNVGAANRKIFQNIAKAFNNKVIWLHIICPENIIFKRLKKRRNMKDDLIDYEIMADKKLYFNRKKIYDHNKALIDFFVTINTARPLTPQINKLVKKLS
ncbi:MAG: ATP-binding protein [Patescibacteria group bacterium]